MRSESSFEIDGDLIVIDVIVTGPKGHVADLGHGIDGVLGMNFLRADSVSESRTHEVTSMNLGHERRNRRRATSPLEAL